MKTRITFIFLFLFVVAGAFGQTIDYVFQSELKPGETRNLSITGTGTHFQSASQVTVQFILGEDTIKSNGIAISSQTSLIAEVTAPISFMPGTYETLVYTSIDGFMGSAYDLYLYSPIVSEINPVAAVRGSTNDAQILFWGIAFTSLPTVHFTQGGYSFSGISVSGEPSGFGQSRAAYYSLQLEIVIPSDAPAGYYDVSAEGEENQFQFDVTPLQKSFYVNGTSYIASINVDQGHLGETHDLKITCRGTHFLSENMTSVSLSKKVVGGGIGNVEVNEYELIVNTIDVLNDTTIVANVKIPYEHRLLGNLNLEVKNEIDGIMIKSNAFNVLETSITVSPNTLDCNCGYPAQILATAVGTHFESDDTLSFSTSYSIKIDSFNILDETNVILYLRCLSHLLGGDSYWINFLTKSNGEIPTSNVVIGSYYDYHPPCDEVSFSGGRDSYSNNFNTYSDHFTGSGFTVSTPEGFLNSAIHSDHPYRSQGDNSYELKFPIRINSQNPLVSFNEVVLVEPGESGAAFGSQDFFDYVVVEATKDGWFWMPLANGYDSRRFDQWLGRYNSSINGYDSDAVGDSTLYRSHRFNLLNEYLTAGDVVRIRFRLKSDGLATGWGWAIDDLEIQTDQVTEASEEIREIPEFEIFPNPVAIDVIRIRSNLGQKGECNFRIISSMGVVVMSGLVSDGLNQRDFEVSNLANGVYVVQINCSGMSAVRKFIKSN